jgi:hypothetical protein
VKYSAMDGSLGRGTLPAEAVLPMAKEAGLDGVEVSLRSDYAEDALWTVSEAHAVRTPLRPSDWRSPHSPY